MGQSVRGEKRPRLVGCVVVFGVILVLVLWVGVFVHDWHLWRFSRAFASVRHPAGTQHVKTFKDLGLLIGNSNHIDYFVGELRSYAGSREQVLKAYSSQSFWSPVEQGRLPVEVLFLEKGKTQDGILYHGEIGDELPYPIRDIADYAKSLGSNGKRYYIIYMFDPGYDVSLDIRGC